MSKKIPQHKHDDYMEKEDCEKDMDTIKDKVNKFDLALFGKDGRGGMVADIKDIKAYTGVVRQVIVPIIIAVVAALLTTWGLTGFHF